MTWWTVTVTSEQAITVGTGTTRAFHTPSFGYIPGSTLRGALARAWLMEHGTGTEFRDTFDGDVRFGPLLAEGSDVASQSVARRKYCPGPGRYIDLAFSADVPPASEQLKGDVVWAAPDSMQTVVRTAIDETTRTAKEGSLFSRQAHRRRRRFTGHIVGDAALVERLREFAQVSIGGLKSVLGRASISIEPAAAPPVTDAERVVLRTLSPSILIDDAGRPCLDIRKAFDGFDVVEAWGGRSTIEGTSGWHAASNTPKPVDAAIAPGAVIALRRPDLEALAGLLARGIGTRRAEGFGWLEAVASPWQPPEGLEEGPGDAPAPQSVPWGEALAWRLRDRRALANWLVELPPSGDIEPIARQRAWKNLTVSQREVAQRVLADTPVQDRNAAASALRRN